MSVAEHSSNLMPWARAAERAGARIRVADVDDEGRAVRAGDMAALPLLKRFGVSEAVRASAFLYSTPADLDRLADALHQISADSVE